jgi:hypothetical protein
MHKLAEICFFQNQGAIIAIGRIDSSEGGNSEGGLSV